MRRIPRIPDRIAPVTVFSKIKPPAYRGLVLSGCGWGGHQRPLPTGATLEEMDLSRYGRGTYVIKFTDRDGVCYERVVVE